MSYDEHGASIACLLDVLVKERFQLLNDCAVGSLERNFTCANKPTGEHEVVRAGQSNLLAIWHGENNEFCMEI